MKEISTKLSIRSSYKLAAIFSFAFLLAVMPTQAQEKHKKHSKDKEVPTDTVEGVKRLVDVMNLVQRTYVDVPNTDSLSEVAVRQILHSLDPHSIYIPAKEVKRANEALQGNFEGVGISFQILNDTIRVAEVLVGGPSEKVGVNVDDKILRIDGINATGDSAVNSFVYRHLRGKKGTMVVVDVLRGRDSITFHIQRDKIPINSIDVYFMEDDSIGYIALERFAATSVDEFRKAVSALKNQGMKSLILDLRGNGGGYLEIACGLSNEFIQRGKLIVYQQGRNVKRRDYRTNWRGSFREGRLVVLIDENSASASEIVSGAVQDWDRGLIIGRRSFGKGLVQTMFTLYDGAQIRLTTARYYTPSGRCIQKPYADYENELRNRYQRGEMFSADSIHLPDTLKFQTAAGRTVYGGGGILPDIFVPMDTTPASKYYQLCRRKGLITQFPTFWVEQHRKDSLLVDFDTFLAHYDELHLDSAFDAYAAEKGVSLDSLQKADTSIATANDNFLRLQVKALVADRLYGRGHYYRIMKSQDPYYKRALITLREEDPLKPKK